MFLYLHGNAANRCTSHRINFYKLLTGLQLNASVLAIDYRGFGNSSKIIPTEITLRQDAQCAFDYIQSQGIGADKIIVVGHSLGSGIATDLVYNLHLRNIFCKGLIILSGYCSLGDAAIGYPVVPVLRPFHGYSLLETLLKYLIKDKFTSYLKIRDITNVPILIMHGKQDIEINIWQAKSLFVSAIEGRLGINKIKGNFWPLRNSINDHELSKLKQCKKLKVGNDGVIWHYKDLWLATISFASHNNLGQHQLVQDTINKWTKLY